MRCEDFQKSEVIDDYLLGRLSEEDREAFGRHYFECDRCFEELKFRENLIRVCREHGETLFADVLNEREAARKGRLADILAKLFPRPFWQRRWVYAAVSVVVIVILIPLLFSTLFAPNKYAQLADIKPYPYLLAGLRSGASEQERLFHEGMRFYTSGEYKLASQRLEKVVAVNSENVLAHFYLGVCSLMDDEPGKATRSLERAAVAQPDTEIFHWYLGQAYLKKGAGDKALREFEKVHDLEGDYRLRAEALIQKIKEIKD